MDTHTNQSTWHKSPAGPTHAHKGEETNASRASTDGRASVAGKGGSRHSGLGDFGLGSFGQLGPVESEAVRPAGLAAELTTRLLLDVRRQLNEPGFRDSRLQPRMHRWPLDAQQPGHGGHAAKALDDFCVVHAPMLAAANGILQAQANKYFVRLG